MQQQHWQCRDGHLWETPAQGQETIADSPHCPVCGAPGAATVHDRPALGTPEMTVDVAPSPVVPPEGTIDFSISKPAANREQTVDVSPGTFAAPHEQTIDHDLAALHAPPSDRTLDHQVEATPPEDQTIDQADAAALDSAPPDGATVDVEFAPEASSDSTQAFTLEKGKTAPPRRGETKDRAAGPKDHTVGDRVERTEGAGPRARTRAGAGKGRDKTQGAGADATTVRVVAGYEILSELGRGGMGVVYKARQPGLNRVVALKMVLAGAHASAEQLARFKIEAEAVAQLQHPNIVQVYEIGEEAGCPFFSLEYIEGDSLAKKCDGTPQPPRDAAQMIKSLAEAMYFAHQRGIIHRDLKPANILLTRDDKPKITDFGLAKRFEDKDEGQTKSGAIMGTPSYMAPEQAQGRTKDTGPPADIYSLGAMLYDLLTGRPPFRGATLLDTLQQVQRAEPVPPLRLQPNLPRDLDTICLKALEKDPRKRYATAGEMAEDLRRYLAGEPISARPTPLYERTWKWARRRPALASLIAVCVVGVLSLLTLGGLWLDSERRYAEETKIAAEKEAKQQQQLARAALEREQAEKERAEHQEKLARFEKERAEKEKFLRNLAEQQRLRAEKNFGHAKDAVDQMLSRVGQEKLAYIPQMEKIRRELLDKARKFYDRFLQEKSNDPGIRYEAALAQQRVADIHEMLGEHLTAQKAYHNALALLKTLAEEFPEKKEYRYFLAVSYSNLGNLLKDIKRNPEAEENYRLALKLRQDLVEQVPDNAEYQLELAKSFNNLGIVLQLLGKTKEAAPAFQESRKLFGELVQRHKEQPSYRQELARSLMNLGTVLKNTGQPAEAEKALLQAGQLLNDLVKGQKEVPDYRQDLAFNLLQLGDFYRDTAPAKAEKAYRDAINIAEKLAADFPRVPFYRQDQAEGYRKLAILLQATGKEKDADAAFDQALAIFEKVAFEYPHLPSFRSNLAAAFNNRALMLLTGNRLKEGETALKKAQALFAQLAQDFPSEPEYQAEEARIALNLGTVWQSLGLPGDAEKSYRAALALRRKLAARFPEMIKLQQELGSTLINLGTLLQLNQQQAEAEKIYLEARDLFAKLHARDLANPDYAHELAVCHSNLASLLRFQGKVEDADKAWRQAMPLLEGLVKDHPEVPGYQQELGRLCNELGIVLVETKREAEAGTIWNRALDLREGLLSKHPDRPDYRQELAGTHANLAILHARKGDAPQAEKSYRKAIDLLEEYEPKLPVTPAYTRELISAHTNLGNLLYGLKRITDAEKSWLRVLALQEKLAKAYPQAPDFRVDLGRTLNDLGEKMLKAEKFAEARTYLEQGIIHLGEALKQRGHDPFAKHMMYVNHLNLTIAHLGLAEHEQAAKTIAAAGPYVPEAQPLYHVTAGLYAKCVPLAEKDAKLDDAKRKELAKSYADLALAQLRLATGKGFNDLAFLQSDDFAPLRNREEFQTLIKGLEKKKK